MASCWTRAKGVKVLFAMSRSVITRLVLVACVSSVPEPSEGVAQTLSSPPMPGLGAAIEGVMGGQFHRSIGVAEKRDLLWSGLGSRTYSGPYWSSPWLDSQIASADSAVSASRILGATSATGLLAYGVAASIYVVCIYVDLVDRPDHRAPFVAGVHASLTTLASVIHFRRRPR